MVSVLILTRNEALDLPACLESVAWSNDVHVLDSGSTDDTVEIARQRGAVVTHRSFDNYASQRNAGLHTLEYRNEWVLILDADERVPEALVREIQEFIELAPASTVAARIRRRDFFMDRWLKHAQLSPFYIRLVRPQNVRYERDVNEVLKADGDVAELASPFDHYPFSKGLRHWLDKHNLYSSMEAEQVIRSRRGQVPFSAMKALTAKDFNERRFHQKEIFYRLPLRPLVKWLYMVVVRRAFMDGRPGMTYALLVAMYEQMIVLKTRELTAREQSSR